jgi:hypothetical protein
MTARDPDRLIRAFLDEGGTELPDRVYSEVRNQIDVTRQRVVFGPWRETQMTNFTRFAIAAVAVVVVAVVAIKLLPGSNGIGGLPTSAPSPTAALPTASPAVVATSTPAPALSPSPGVTLTQSRVGTPLAAGTYYVADPFGQPLRLSLPDEWTLSTLKPGIIDLWRSTATDDANANTLSIARVNKVFADPCHNDLGPKVETNTVQEIVAALTSQTGFQAGPVTDIQIDGAAGKTFELQNSIDTETARCTGGLMLWQWTTAVSPTRDENAGTNGGTRERFWVLDVNGAPLVIQVMSFSWTTAADRQSAERIPETLQFE